MQLRELLDISVLRRLAEANFKASGMPIGIIDAVDGSALVAVGWQDICTLYHRVNPITLERCRESDEHIKQHLAERAPCEHKCRNGLRDIGVPVQVDGQQLATLLLGQFFYEGESPDRDFFIQQARQFGFDEPTYLAALDRVPVFPRAVVENILAYNMALAQFISELAEGSLRRRRAEMHIESLARFPQENPDPVLRLAQDLTVTYANDAAASALSELGITLGRCAPVPIAEIAQRAMDEKRRIRGDVAAGERTFSMSALAAGHEVNIYAHDISARVHAEDALRDSESRHRLLFQNMLDGYAYCRMLFDGDGRPDDFVYLDVNSAFGKLTGLHDVVGRKVTEVIRDIRNAHPELLQVYGRVARTGQPERLDLEFRPLGKWLSLSVYGPKPDHFVAVFDDITSRKRVEQEMRDASRAKDDFLGMLSHELRNPLAPIRNSLYILDHAEPTGEAARRAKEVAGRQLVHLTRLVDDLLDVTRIVRGKVELRRTQLDLAELTRRVGEDHRALMRDRGLRFDVRAPQDAVWVDGDETRLAQVIGNLLQNAAKFTPKDGRVTVTVVPAPDAVEVRVTDTGVGIDAELLSDVFNPFVQAKQSLARTEGGLGLGLALVKGLVELHGGTVTAFSGGREQGAAFALRLPLLASAPSDPEAPGRPVPRPMDALRVLVVDDNEDAAESLAELVRMLGYEAEVALDGWSAVEMVKANPPDIVLCDIGLPGMSGYQVAEELRADERFDSVQLIAVSGYALPEDRQKALLAGFAEHIAKPADPAMVLRLLRRGKRASSRWPTEDAMHRG